MPMQATQGGLNFTSTSCFWASSIEPKGHNVYTYYEDVRVLKLFRKVMKQKFSLGSATDTVRDNGDFIYEKFLQPASRVDANVYAVAGNYFHFGVF